MSPRRSRARRPDPRPHPDPAVERELERIRLLQRRYRVKEDQVNDYRAEIVELHDELRRFGRRLTEGYGRASDVKHAIETADKRVLALQAEIRQVEGEIGKIHDEIGARQDKLSPSDLSYL